MNTKESIDQMPLVYAKNGMFHKGALVKLRFTDSKLQIVEIDAPYGNEVSVLEEIDLASIKNAKIWPNLSGKGVNLAHVSIYITVGRKIYRFQDAPGTKWPEPTADQSGFHDPNAERYKLACDQWQVLFRDHGVAADDKIWLNGARFFIVFFGLIIVVLGLVTLYLYKTNP